MVDAVDVRPVAARTDADDVAELVVVVLFRQVLRAHRVRREAGIDVQAHRALVEYLDVDVAVRIEDLVQAPVVHHPAGRRLDLGDHVAHRADVLAVRPLVVGAGDPQEIVAVGRYVERVREVVVGGGQLAVEDLLAHDVVLDVALAVAPGQRAVAVLLEAHHHAGPVDAVDVIDGLRVHRPADLTPRVDDEVDRVVVPLERPADRVVPHRARALAGLGQEVVDEIQPVRELRLDLVDLRLGEEGRPLGRDAGRVGGHRPDIDGVGLLQPLFLAGMDARVLDLDLVGVVRVQAEHGNAAVRLQVPRIYGVADLLAALLRHDPHRRVADLVAAVANDGRQRRDFVRVDDHLTQLALDGVVELRTAGTTDREGRAGGDRRGDRGGERQRREAPADDGTGLHDDFSVIGFERVPAGCGVRDGESWVVWLLRPRSCRRVPGRRGATSSA